jgi:malate dehydrogenase
LGIGKITDYETKLIQAAIKELKANIEKGVKFANEQYKK